METSVGAKNNWAWWHPMHHFPFTIVEFFYKCWWPAKTLQTSSILLNFCCWFIQLTNVLCLPPADDVMQVVVVVVFRITLVCLRKLDLHSLLVWLKTTWACHVMCEQHASSIEQLMYTFCSLLKRLLTIIFYKSIIKMWVKPCGQKQAIVGFDLIQIWMWAVFRVLW